MVVLITFDNNRLFPLRTTAYFYQFFFYDTVPVSKLDPRSVIILTLFKTLSNFSIAFHMHQIDSRIDLFGWMILNSIEILFNFAKKKIKKKTEWEIKHHYWLLLYNGSHGNSHFLENFDKYQTTINTMIHRTESTNDSFNVFVVFCSYAFYLNS